MTSTNTSPNEGDDRTRAAYLELRPRYDRLGINLQQALQSFLEEAHIPFLSIQYRIKEFSSFSEKLQRKSYSNPFEDVEDFCGLRIICYYPSDVERICNLVRTEFQILGDEDTATRLKLSEFGYRSTHLIVGIKNEWLNAPNYRGLGDLKTEIQVRTVLMHAWAEIEHKLAYKSEQQVPDMFRRRLYRLSAKFEEADEQFEDLRHNLDEYRAVLQKQAQDTGRFKTDVELNLDTLQTFMDFHLLDRTRSIDDTRALFEELSELGIQMQDLVDGYERAKQWLEEMEFDILNAGGVKISKGRKRWSQVGVIRFTLDVTCDRYWDYRYEALDQTSGWFLSVREWRDRIKSEN